MSEEYRVKVSVSNNLLLRAIEDAGYKSQSDFARAMDIHPASVNALVAMRECPINKNGGFSPLATQVMEFLGACPTDLWTEDQLTMKLRTNSSWSAMGREELIVLMGGEPTGLLEGVLKQELKTKMAEALQTLTPKEQKLLALRFEDGLSMEDIGKVFGCSRERIRQVEVKALRKIRQRDTANNDELKSFTE